MRAGLGARHALHLGGEDRPATRYALHRGPIDRRYQFAQRAYGIISTPVQDGLHRRVPLVFGGFPLHGATGRCPDHARRPFLSFQVFEARTRILQTVMTVSGSVESAAENSEPIRAMQRTFSLKSTDPYGSLKTLAPNVPDSRINAVRGEYSELVARANRTVARQTMP